MTDRQLLPTRVYTMEGEEFTCAVICEIRGPWAFRTVCLDDINCPGCVEVLHANRVKQHVAESRAMGWLDAMRKGKW